MTSFKCSPLLFASVSNPWMETLTKTEETRRCTD
jgi:hypothetical protein